MMAFAQSTEIALTHVIDIAVNVIDFGSGVDCSLLFAVVAERVIDEESESYFLPSAIIPSR